MNKNLIAVQYIGRRELWIEKTYRSGLSFKKDQVRAVPEALARKLIRHADLFKLSEDEPVSAPEKPDAQDQDDTEELLAEAQKQAEENQQKESNRQDLIDSVMLMEDKDALQDFAFRNYQQKLNKRCSVETLRQEVVAMIDQFGVV